MSLKRKVRETTLFWFRSDLRLNDSHALYRASFTNVPIVGLYVFSPQEYKRHDWAPVKLEFLLNNLRLLKSKCNDLGIPLLIITEENSGNVANRVKDLALEISATSVFWNIEYEVDEGKRDEKTSTLLKEHGIKSFGFHDQCVQRPGNVLSKEGKSYSVFTPFKKAWILGIQKEGSILDLYPPPKKQEVQDIDDFIWTMSQESKIPINVEELGFITKKLSIPLSKEWPAGEEEASKRLLGFLTSRGSGYSTERNIPSNDGTSRLSPYLAIGVLSSRKCVAEAKKANNGSLDSGNSGLVTWISELIWRDFYRHILVAHPRVCKNKAFKADTDSIPWSYDEDLFQKWCQGKTGYPIVDAGMRQLNETGWMHNRLRMIVAMFLTKHLLIDWRLGEKYFMQNLIDGDFASNNGGWQWASSTGTDSQPYFRIFSPILQSERFDKEGRFVKKFVPELSSLKGKAVYDPFQTLPKSEFAKLGYPKPLVDHKMARDKCLDTFKTALANFKK